MSRRSVLRCFEWCCVLRDVLCFKFSVPRFFKVSCLLSSDAVMVETTLFLRGYLGVLRFFKVSLCCFSRLGFLCCFGCTLSFVSHVMLFLGL